MKTIEGNKQITEFMENGNNYKAIKCKHKILYDCPQVIEPVEDYFLEYDSSWDWLMPVVEKIELLGMRVAITTNSIVIERQDKSILSAPPIIKFPARLSDESKRFAVWECVVEFIKWHNEKDR